MKIGLIISGIIVALLGLVFFMAWRGVADGPSRKTAPELLQKIELPADLPTVIPAGDPTQSANEAYQRMFKYFQDNDRELRRREPAPEKIQQVADLMLAGMKAGKVSEPFLDDQLPMNPAGEPAFADAYEKCLELTLKLAIDLFEKKDYERAANYTLATWALGERAFRHSKRFYFRHFGMMAMQSACELLFLHSEHVPSLPKLDGWVKIIKKIDQSWTPKMEIVLTPTPPIGDLLNIVAHDQDPTWRIEAILKLGVAKFNPGHRGNMRAINKAIAAAKSNPDPLLAQAGQGADQFTVQELRRMH